MMDVKLIWTYIQEKCKIKRIYFIFKNYIILIEKILNKLFNYKIYNMNYEKINYKKRNIYHNLKMNIFY